MDRRWIFAGLLVLVLGAIAALVFLGPDRDWGPRDQRAELVQVVDDEGNPVAGANTIVVERDRHGFPFGLFVIPLLLLLVFGLFRGLFWGPPGGGPWGSGGAQREQWLDEWHKRQHREPASEPKPSSTESS